MKAHLLTTTVVVALGVHSMAEATVFNVPNGGNIQAAINAAVDFDTIIVANGTFNTKLDFLGKDITVKSVNGPNFTTINATGQNGSAVVFQSGETELAVLDGFKLTGGTGTNFGGRFRGGGVFSNMAAPIVKNCIITLNSAQDGGGAYNFVGDTKYLNCVFDNNASESGGGIYSNLANPAVFNCTISRNTAGIGGGITGFQGTTRLISAIVWNNSGDSFGGSGAKIVTHSDVQGGFAGAGNIDLNPMFVNRNNDFRLGSASPCVDAGDSTAIASTLHKDVIGNPRGVDVAAIIDTGIPVLGMVVDMGAYELQNSCASSTCPADITKDGRVLVDDLLAVINAWGNCP